MRNPGNFEKFRKNYKIQVIFHNFTKISWSTSIINKFFLKNCKFLKMRFKIHVKLTQSVQKFRNYEIWHKILKSYETLLLHFLQKVVNISKMGQNKNILWLSELLRTKRGFHFSRRIRIKPKSIFTGGHKSFQQPLWRKSVVVTKLLTFGLLLSAPLVFYFRWPGNSFKNYSVKFAPLIRLSDSNCLKLVLIAPPRVRRKRRRDIRSRHPPERQCVIIKSYVWSI